MMQRTLPLIAIVLLLACTAQLVAQESRGTIVGTVTDPTGAVVPAASVQVVNVAMGTKLALSTNEAGVFQAAYLIPGAYSVTIEAPGFRRIVREGVEVRVNDRLALSFALEVGAAAESVTVTGETPLLEVGTASLGAVVDGRRITELPIPHGNVYFLIALAPGVTFARDPRLDRPHEPTHIVGYAMDGTRANRSDVTIDGLPSTSTANAYEVTASYVPPSDIIAEFKVQTATFDAGFGQTEGGVTNISIKSGTNSLHGAAYYTKMAPSMFANDWFANARRVAKPDFYYDRWGGSAGGPVWIPKLYDGRNRTFFQWGYEGIHEGRPRNNGTPTVPTEKMKTGDFSDLLGVSANYQIYNPFSRVAEGSRFRAQPFAGNQIPESLINPIAKKILTYYPKPIGAGLADGTRNYERPEMQEVIKYYTHTIRGDQIISDRQRLYARVSWYRRDADYNNYFDNLSTGTKFQFLSRAGVIDDVYTLSPTTVLNVRYGYNRFIRNDQPNPESNGFDLTTLGFPAAYNNSISPQLRSFPRIEMTGYQNTAFGNDLRPTDIHSFTAAVQKSVRTHFLKAGMEFRAYRENSISTSRDQTGRFNFDATWTRGPLDNATAAPGSIGQSVASLLLGLPASTNTYVARNASYAEQSTSWGFFLQDDWKATHKLTVNMGLRWEFEGPLTERFNRSVRSFDPTAAQPFEAQAQANYAKNITPEVPASQFVTKGGVNFAGVGGQPRGAYDTPKLNLMPRFGITYQLAQRTVLRGGYGIFYGFLGQRRGDVITSGFSRNTTFVPTLNNIDFTNTLSNPYPTGILEPLGSGQGAQTFVGQSINVYSPKPLMPYMQRWEIGIQQELPGAFLAEIGYVGNRGTHIQFVQNINTTPQKYLSTSPVRDQATINYLSANVPNPFTGGLLPTGAGASLIGTNIARERLLRPYPHFDNIWSERFDGYSWYHSLQTRLERRFSKGFTVNTNYTYSKFMEAIDLLNQSDAKPTEVISDMDFRHRFVVSGIWELPFGRGRGLLADVHPVVSGFISGWQLSGYYSLQSGAPITFGRTTTNIPFGATPTVNSVIFNGSFADIPLAKDQRSPYRWFNTSGFVTNSAQQLDTTRQLRTFPLRLGNVRGDRVNNFDLGVIKNTRVAEGKNIQFKAEILNAFNHPQFPLPASNATNPANADFGWVGGGSTSSNQANYPRRIQLSAKFIF